MIAFTPLRTPRLAVTLRELTIQEIIGLLGLPPRHVESGVTQFLTLAAQHAAKATPAHVTDPRMMTVQERTRLVAHYIAHVNEGGADFAVGDGRFSDYLILGDDWKGAPVVMTAPDGAVFTAWPLLGWMAEGLEKVCESAGEWEAGAMACQLFAAGDAAPNPVELGDAGAIDWVKARVDSALALPESEFLARLALWDAAEEKLRHLFAIGYAEDGLLILPTTEANEGARVVAPCRFRVSAAFSAATAQMFGRTVRGGG